MNAAVPQTAEASRRGCLRSANQRISSFEKNPASGGMPAMAAVATANVTNVTRNLCAQARPSCVMSCSPPSAWITLPGAEEQAGLEERVRVEMEDRDAVRADAKRDEHEAELRDRRVREHLLDVGLHDGDRRREEGRERADQRRSLASASGACR